MRGGGSGVLLDWHQEYRWDYCLGCAIWGFLGYVRLPCWADHREFVAGSWDYWHKDGDGAGVFGDGFAGRVSDRWGYSKEPWLAWFAGLVWSFVDIVGLVHAFGKGGQGRTFLECYCLKDHGRCRYGTV